MSHVSYLDGAGSDPDEGEQDEPAGQGRHRHPGSAWQMSATEWKDVLLRTWQQVGEDRLLAVAAGVVFYGLLALFPAITALVSSYGLFATGSTINEHLSMLAGMLPESAFGIVRDQVDRVLAKGDVTLGLAFLFSLLLAIWSANGGIKAVIDALNVAYEVEEKRGILKLNAVSLTFTFGALIAALLAIGCVVALPIVLAAVGLGALTDALFRIGRWPVLVMAMLSGLALLYRFGPDRRAARWHLFSAGSVFATLAWLGGSALLSSYVANYADYDATYGSLGAAIGLMMWMWMSAIVVLLGAELNSEIERQTTPYGR